MNALALAEEIIAGRRLQRGDEELTELLSTDLEELCQAADKLRETFCEDKVDLCTIINGRSGRCSEDCKYCAQSAHSKTGCEEYAFLPEDVIVAACKANEREILKDEEILRALAIFRMINPEANIRLAGGRSALSDNGAHSFACGVSATITGNMLTTSGSTIQQDKAMLRAMGRDVQPEWEKYPVRPACFEGGKKSAQ